MSKLLKNWSLSRILRLLLGIGAAVYAVVGKEPILFIVAAMFILQATLNISCCGVAGCSSPSKADKQVYKDQIGRFIP